MRGRQWLYTGTAQERQVDKIYALPLNAETYLEVAFSLMPNDNVVAREFVDLAMIRVNAIVDSFDLHYAQGSAFDKVTSAEWMDKTILGKLESHENKKLLTLE